MFYKFPVIHTLDDVLPAIKDREEFIVAERDWGYVVNYHVNLIDSFPEISTRNDEINAAYAMRRECRGIKFGLDRKIIARPFHKFFNVNERPETLDVNIDWNQKFSILHKMDGSMIHPININDEIFWCSKMGLTDVAEQATAFVNNNTKYVSFAKAMIMRGFTPLFEWCSRSQRIVIDYPEDQLILLAARNMVTGEYLPFHNLQNCAKIYDIPVVDSFDGTFDNIKSFLEDVQARDYEEGYVLRFDNGHALKAKNLWYCQIHKVKEALAFEKDVWRIVLQNDYDDVKAFMSDEDKDRIDRFADDLNKNIVELADKMKWIVIELQDRYGDSRKRFAEAVLKDYKEYSQVLFLVADGKDPEEVIRNYIMKGVNSGPKLETVRHLANNIRWEDY